MNLSQKEEYIKSLNSSLDEIRPHLKVDGGNVEIVDVEENGVVLIKWSGNCEFCNMSEMTLKAGIEQTLKARHPEITTVKALNGIVNE